MRRSQYLHLRLGDPHPSVPLPEPADLPAGGDPDQERSALMVSARAPGPRTRGRVMLMIRSLALACVSAVLFGALTSSAQSAPLLPLGHAGRWVTDARGRVVVVHGINMVYKLPPYYPATAGFDNDDAAFLQRIGFNVVRVGVIWKAVEPLPGVYDEQYLRRIGRTVATLSRHHILSLLDFHQDQYNERFQGEGFPDWSVQDDGLTGAAEARVRARLRVDARSV